MSQGDDEWDFKVDAPEPKKETEREKKRQKRNSKRKREPLFGGTEKTLKVDEGAAPRRVSRSALASQEGGRAIKGRQPIMPAPFMRRVVGSIIDSIVFSGLVGASTFITTGMVEPVTQLFKDIYLYDLFSSLGLDDTAMTAVVSGFIVYFLYMIFPLVAWRKTLGKNLVGIEVRGSDKPEFGFGKAFFRETIAKFISFGIILGYIWPLFNKQRRSLHDLIAGTIVIKTEK